MATPRGVRNNNPGNIDFNPRNAWQGQLGIEVNVAKPRFARFDQAENGIRALGKLLLNYRGKDGMPGVGRPGIDTPLEFISRWAPSSENNTLAYAIVHENGGNPYKSEVIDEGIRRALA